MSLCLLLFLFNTRRFLYCFRSPYILQGSFINFLASSVPSCGPFNDIISSAFRISFFRVLLLFVLIRYISLPSLSGQALLTGMMEAILANELMIEYSSEFIVAQIYLSVHSVDVCCCFKLFLDNFSFKLAHFFLIDKKSNLKLSHSSIKVSLFSSSLAKSDWTERLFHCHHSR